MSESLSSVSIPIPDPPPDKLPDFKRPKSQIRLNVQDRNLILSLPLEPEEQLTPWFELWEQLKHRLNGSERFWTPQTKVHLVAHDRLLDGRQLQEIADALNEVNLKLKLVKTSRRQTAVAAATAGYSVEQVDHPSPLGNSIISETETLADPLYLSTTVRSGVQINHPGSIIILGDVNPGGILVAASDIIVWGRLRGIAHAGSNGNSQSVIMALQMEPTQLRIGDQVARAPDTKLSQMYPEVAYITKEGIRITRADDFSRHQLTKP